MSNDAVTSLQAGNLFSVNGLVAVVTGGGSGLGAYMARTFAVNGASKVFIIGRREDSLKTVAGSLPDTKTIIPVVGDVSSKESLAKCYEEIAAQVSHIDVLVANSGIAGPPMPFLDKEEKPLSIEQVRANMLAPEVPDITNAFTINVVGVQLTVATFLPLLDAANKKRPDPTATNFTPRPQIITTSSIGAFNRKPLGNLCYGPSKAAVVHMTKQLSTMLVPYDIRANTIAPGLYYSEMTERMYSKEKAEAHNVEGTFEKSFIPATRSGDEEDIAGAILYLTSRAGAYINGNVLVTDGGRLSVMPATY